MDKILIIGGNSKFLATVKAGLENVGLFEVVVAADDLLAVEILFSQKVSVVVIDINTPAVDCLETIAYMTRAHPSIPLVLMTDYGKPWFKHKDGKQDSLYHLPKPFELGVLVSAIFVGLNLKDEGKVQQGLNMKSLLPLIQAQRKTCRMEVKTKGKTRGFLYFNEGTLMDAHFEGLSSEAAAREISQWNSIAIRIVDLPGKRIRTRVQADLMDLADATWTTETPLDRRAPEADADGSEAFSLNAAVSRKKAVTESLGNYASEFRGIRGFIGLAVTNGRGGVLARIRADEGPDLDRLALDLQEIMPRLSGSLETCELGRMSALVLDAPAGTVFVVRSSDASTASCQLTGLTTANASRASMKTHMQTLLSHLMAALD